MEVETPLAEMMPPPTSAAGADDAAVPAPVANGNAAANGEENGGGEDGAGDAGGGVEQPYQGKVSCACGRILYLYLYETTAVGAENFEMVCDGDWFLATRRVLLRESPRMSKHGTAAL